MNLDTAIELLKEIHGQGSCADIEMNYERFRSMDTIIKYVEREDNKMMYKTYKVVIRTIRALDKAGCDESCSDMLTQVCIDLSESNDNFSLSVGCAVLVKSCLAGELTKADALYFSTYFPKGTVGASMSFDAFVELVKGVSD